MLALVQERDPLRLETLPTDVQSWLAVVGGFALVVLLIGFVLRILRTRDSAYQRSRGGLTSNLIFIVFTGIFLTVLPSLLRILWNWMGWIDESVPTFSGTRWYQPLLDDFRARPREKLGDYGYRVLIPLALNMAFAAVLLPVFEGILRMRWRRIWALARLSFKEAIRRRVLWGFSAILLVLLFAQWFLPHKPEDQVRNYVKAVYFAMTVLFLAIAALLASFSIPQDIRNQTIHTIVTKPVERFEIILGRMLGFMGLLTLVLVFMSFFCLIYVARGVDEDAREESLKARVPVYGELLVTNPKNVGHIWEYRKYITGAVKDEEAIWTFHRLPAGIEKLESPRAEFTFNIFRTTKGEENKGVFVTFAVNNSAWQPSKIDDYTRERDATLNEQNPEIVSRAEREHWSEQKKYAMLLSPLAEKYGYFELNSKEVFNQHTLNIDLPPGLFKNLEQARKAGSRQPPLRVVVRCESATQYLGMAKYDLYLLATEPSAGGDLLAFSLNFLKGATGLWFRMLLVVGVAVTCSTYLSGVISFLCTMLLYFGGVCVEFIRSVAEGKTVGGGPLQNMIRLAEGINAATPMDQSPGVLLAMQTDKAFQVLIGRLLSMIPDVDRMDLTNFVAEGFDISGTQLLLTGIMLVGYLLPWLLLAYYLIRSREVASSM